MQDLQRERSAEDWLKALVEEDRAPVFARSDQPDGKVIRQLERAGAVIRLPGDVIVLRRPADNRDEVLRRVHWPIVEALLSNYTARQSLNVIQPYGFWLRTRRRRRC